jgi:hypothetical protein
MGRKIEVDGRLKVTNYMISFNQNIASQKLISD